MKKNKVNRSKGQIFLAGAVILLVGLIVLRNLLGVYGTIEEKRYQESLLYDDQLMNIKNEYQYIVGISTLQSNVNESAVNYLSNFSNYLRNEISDFRVLYLFVFVNGSNQKYSITLGNFLNDKINATVSVSDSTPSNISIGSMNDKSNSTNEFQSNVNGTVNITLGYQIKNLTITEMIPITSNKNITYGLFDITLNAKDLMVRTKYVCNRTW